MNNTSIKMRPAFNSRAVIWDLLEQWKAILIVALLCALIIPGIKYAKDMSSYKAQLANKAAEEAQGTVSAEEKTEEILSSLSDADKSDVLYVLDAKEWIRKQRDYLNESVIMNVDPTNQRTILLDYQITAEDPGDMPSVMYGYLGYLYNEDVLSQVGSVIAPGADSKYIAETISFDRDKYNYIDAGTNKMVLEIRVVAPETVDMNAVEEALTNCLKGYSKEMAGNAGNNSIMLLGKTDFRRYNGEAVNNRTNITYSIYNVQNNLRNGASALSDQAKAAIASIEAIQTAEREAAVAESQVSDESTAQPEDPPKPGFSKKYAVLGFILGAVMYALAYLLLGILKGIITSAVDMGYYGGGRLIGEIYSNKNHRGLSQLTHSKLVDNFRFRGKLEPDKQIEKIASSLEAICNHADIDNLSLLCMPGLFKGATPLLARITDITSAKGININTIALEEEINDSSVSSVENAVIVAGKGCRISDLVKINELCEEYDVKRYGDIYMQEI